MSSKEKDAYERAQAEIKGRVQATLGNPRFKAALEELRTLTPAGEPLFGFQIQTKDARAEVPAAEHVELEDGAAVIAAKEAATAYVESVEPTAGLSPRMPTSRVRLNGEPAARDAAALRRQSTQPSIAKGGVGPRPPSLDAESTEGEEVEVTGAAAVLDRPAPRPRPAARVANEPASQREGETSRGRVWMAVAVGLLVVGGVAGLVLRTRDGNRGEAVSAASTTAPANAVPGASNIASASARSTASSPGTAAAVTATAAPSGVEAATAMPSAQPAPIVVPTTSVTVKPTPAPRSTGEAPAPPKATPPSIKPSGLSPAPSATATPPPEPAGPAPRYTDPDF